jgi:hypothetical protein
MNIDDINARAEWIKDIAEAAFGRVLQRSDDAIEIETPPTSPSILRSGRTQKF